MYKHPELTRARIEAFLWQVLEPSLWADEAPLQTAVCRRAPGRDYRAMKPAPAPADDEYTPVEPGYAWGPVWSDAWFNITGAVPAAWSGKTVVARLKLGSEAIVWQGDCPLQGVDGNHEYIRLFESAEGGESIHLTAQATCMNPNVSCNGRPKEPSATPATFEFAKLAVLDPERMGLYYDVKIALGLLDALKPQNVPAGMPAVDSPRYGQLLYALNDVVNLYDAEDPAAVVAARARLAETYNKPASASAHKVSAIGHSHIDSAWLWPLERTQYKCLHTWSTVVNYMDQYPEYKFACSQAAQYEWVKNMAPALYERIKEKIRSGQWEVTGSMWVEADCNVSSGESLVRQVLLGKNYFQDEFGIETKDLWLPDVFGYAAALPQILKKAGVDYFMTQKISWNQTNKFPHHTFMWQGIDGTQIFTHFPPADTYNAMVTPGELAYNVRNFRDNDRSERSLYVFGYGDGGGGPTVEMLENARRLKDVEGMPRVEMEKALDFFHKAEAEAKDLPVWVGELYLELHRGTYTTQARNKRNNRKSELALRDAEFLSAVNPAGLAAYPFEELNRAWKTTLLNQFHDIIPGSSIAEVYADSAVDYAEIARVTGEVIGIGTCALADAVNTVGMKRPALVISNLSHFATEAVEVAITAGAPAAALGPDGDVMPVQLITRPDGARSALFIAKNTPLHGYAVWDLGATTLPPESEDPVIATPTSLENELMRVEFDSRTGLITSIYDKESEREVLAEAPLNASDEARMKAATANQLWLFEDRPNFWDAWDVDIFYAEKGRLITELDGIEVVESGPVRGALKITRSFGKSKITQTIRLTSGSPRLDFITEVDWHEKHKMLKVAFPVNINSPRATYEIQYGHTERPTHFNTSWDQARFEVCAQKWVDLSEGDYGVALLNDCKYGHDTRGNTMRLTLLRSPEAPDPEADQGVQIFTYALLPHVGGIADGEVIENAYALNSPPSASLITANKPGSLPVERSFFEVDNAAVFIEAIKRAEREDAIIVRLYEAQNTRGEVTLTTTLPVKRAFLADLLERNVVELTMEAGSVLLPITPFEIVTVKFEL